MIKRVAIKEHLWRRVGINTYASVTEQVARLHEYQLKEHLSVLENQLEARLKAYLKGKYD